ncbi:hypothetical protein [Schumannella soli]|jgi:hypothetical protein|uniref:4-hydroxybenzoate polyprenyltransferase n=1 Tax=Schumannella soli TaxID=2590779 RepID=A0A506Y295_9MICO|nr:hypothetical protein [Schumannella soli]TPW74519.1 hypothetical protein FJ657_13020 [Schumannella soli]
MTTLALVLAEAEEHHPIFAPTWVFPLIAAVFFIGAAFVVWSYRDVANRHSDKVGDAVEHTSGMDEGSAGHSHGQGAH